MSRSGSFPPELAAGLLSSFAKPGSTVYDPFCGKGTTLFAGRALGMKVYGSDVAPEAIVCSRAKLASVDLRDVLDYVEGIEITGSGSLGGTSRVRAFFHPVTLKELLSLREHLSKDSSSSFAQTRRCAEFATAAVLGILHGKATYSLSIPSPHSFSMSPAYVRRYAADHGLARPKKEVRACLAEKVKRVLSVPLPPKVVGDARRGSAVESPRIFSSLRGKTDIILTSPPYLNAQTYAKDNWLRLWFLGHDNKTLQPDYIETGSVPKYLERMREALRSSGLMLKKGGTLICIAGDVRLRSKRTSDGRVPVFKTGKALAKLCLDEDVGLSVIYESTQKVASHARYFHILSKVTGHSKQALTERIFIARK